MSGGGTSIAAITFTLLLAAALPPPAAAVESPGVFEGALHVNGAPAPPGVPIEAWLGTTGPLAEARTGPGGAFTLVVRGDDPATPAIEGPRPGQAVTFRAGAAPASGGPVEWRAGETRRADLSVPLPDFAVTNVTVAPSSPRVGDSATLVATVRNSGAAPAGGHVAFFAGEAGATPTVRVPFEDLRPGETRSIAAPWVVEAGATRIAAVAVAGRPLDPFPANDRGTGDVAAGPAAGPVLTLVAHAPAASPSPSDDVLLHAEAVAERPIRNVTFRWRMGDGVERAVADVRAPFLVNLGPFPSGTRITYSAEAADASGLATRSPERTLTVAPPAAPRAFALPEVAVPAGGSLLLVASTPDGSADGRWIADGAASVERVDARTARARFDAPANRTASFLVGGAQATAGATTLVRVLPAEAAVPAAPRVVAAPRTLHVFEAATLEGEAGPGERLAWFLGDGRTVEGGRALVRYSDAGRYTLALVSVGDSGATAVSPFEVEVVSPPGNRAPVPRLETRAIAGGAHVAEATGTTDPDGGVAETRVLWGDGTASAAGEAHAYERPGTYTVTLLATDAEGLTTWTTRSLVVAAPALAFRDVSALGEGSDLVVAGRVLRPDGDPAPNAAVEAAADGGRKVSGRTGPDGSFTLVVPGAGASRTVSLLASDGKILGRTTQGVAAADADPGVTPPVTGAAQADAVSPVLLAAIGAAAVAALAVAFLRRR